MLLQSCKQNHLFHPPSVHIALARPPTQRISIHLVSYNGVEIHDNVCNGDIVVTINTNNPTLEWSVDEQSVRNIQQKS